MTVGHVILFLKKTSSVGTQKFPVKTETFTRKTGSPEVKTELNCINQESLIYSRNLCRYCPSLATRYQTTSADPAENNRGSPVERPSNEKFLPGHREPGPAGAIDSATAHHSTGLD